MLRIIVRIFKNLFKYVLIISIVFLIGQLIFDFSQKLNDNSTTNRHDARIPVDHEPTIKLASSSKKSKSINRQIKNVTNLVNACLFVLIRNKELKVWKKTMIEFEKNFNSRYNYPYIFMNDVPFSAKFKSEVLKLTKATVEFGLVPTEHWSIPKWIDTNLLRERLNTTLKKMFRGTMISYHHMCRYYSGFFFRHELTLKYDYFWRLEPKVSFPCEIVEDPFLKLINGNKLYGFSISRPELMNTIPTLWDTIKSWLNTGYNKMIPPDNFINYISDDNGTSLNQRTCTFFNNFEIGAFSVFRDQKYLDFFNYLDKTGGFFYERWGDSAVNTFYLALMLSKEQVHLFNNIAYFHPPRYYCPKHLPPHCVCKMDRRREATYKGCFDKWNSIIDGADD